MKEKFAESEFLYGVPEKLGGAICMHYDEISGKGDFVWTHTTSSMGIAFQTTADERSTTRYNNDGKLRKLWCSLDPPTRYSYTANIKPLKF